MAGALVLGRILLTRILLPIGRVLLAMAIRILLMLALLILALRAGLLLLAFLLLLAIVRVIAHRGYSWVAAGTISMPLQGILRGDEKTPPRSHRFQALTAMLQPEPQYVAGVFPSSTIEPGFAGYQERNMTATMRKIVPLFLLLGIFGVQALVLTGCNTAEGFGQDVENTGEALQEGARDAKKDLN